MRLLQTQQVFSCLVARLIDEAVRLGFQVVIGETYRPPETAALYAKQGRGTTHSLHTVKLAVDLLLFRGERWLQDAEDYAALGAWWKRQHELAAWGGDFPSRDANHFSLRWMGRA